MRYNDNKFWEHNIPFSFNFLLEEGNFEEFSKTEQYRDNYNEWIDRKATRMIVEQEEKERKLKELDDN